MMAAKHSMMGGGGLPFTPIYGVRSDGRAYCALPENINASHGAYEIDMTVDSISYEDLHLFGAHGIGGGAYFLYHIYSQGCFYCFGYQNMDRVLEYGKRHIYKVSRDSSGQSQFMIDGETAAYGADTWEQVYNSSRFLVFRANANTAEVQPQASKSPTNIVIHRLNVWYGDRWVADLYPCRDTEGEVCFYNAVDRTFLRNIAGGSSAFIEEVQA